MRLIDTQWNLASGCPCARASAFAAPQQQAIFGSMLARSGLAITNMDPENVGSTSLLACLLVRKNLVSGHAVWPAGIQCRIRPKGHLQQSHLR